MTHSFPTRRSSDLALTTNHTKFFRENHHFDHFAQNVRPALIRRALTGGRVRMWSVGCSSGEEVYSLTMTLLGEDKANARRIAESDIAIIASDLADKVIGNGRGATYYAKRADEESGRTGGRRKRGIE